MTMEDRVLLLALRGRDSDVIKQLLSRRGDCCQVCRDGAELARELARGSSAAVVTEESLIQIDRRPLVAWLKSQPPWSDFPFILLSTKRTGRRSVADAAILDELGNVVVLERPIHGETLGSAVASALRGRRRQYDARRRLRELEAAQSRVTLLNATLESRIRQRTHELALANDQLMQEIAERERAQAALVQSQKMEAVGQITGGIAHDFNNLLMVIAGNLELIHRRGADERTTALAGFAVQAAERAAKLTRQLLAFSRTQRLTLTPVDINGLIEGMNELLSRTIGAEFAVEMDLAPEAAWAMADANQVELAILNLVINARDAMPKGGAVRISSRRVISGEPDLRPGAYTVVGVADTGVGIPGHLLARVFDPFFTTKEIGKGTGLGLSQVFGIAQQSGGTVKIDSIEGEGCLVEVWLPSTNAVDQRVEDPPERQGGRRRRERVLIVEDDPGVRRFLMECLDSLGHQAIEAADGEEGLRRLREEKPSLLIVDFAMPGMNGVEVIARARGYRPEMPVIMATGYADMDAVHQIVDPTHVLRKPFRIDDLESAMRRVQRASRRESGPWPSLRQ